MIQLQPQNLGPNTLENFAFVLHASILASGAGKYVESGGGGQAEKVRPLLKLMQFIGALYGGKTVTQVSLNYLVSQGKQLVQYF